MALYSHAPLRQSVVTHRRTVRWPTPTHTGGAVYQRAREGPAPTTRLSGPPAPPVHRLDARPLHRLVAPPPLKLKLALALW